MYGVPADLDLRGFIGATLVQVCLGQYILQFHFQASDGQMPAIGVEGDWTLTDSAGTVVDRADAGGVRDCYRVHVIIGSSVVGSTLDAPHSFALTFASGHELRVFDSSTEYESFSIQPGNVFA